MMQKSKDFKLNVYIRHTRQGPKVNGQLVMLGYDVTTCTPASYQRCSLSTLRNLILWLASYLDAFSTYPIPT